jgi:hypothetical protein
MAGIHRKRKRTTTTDDYAAMLRRMILAYGTRIGAEPAEGLAHLRELETALADSVNLGIYTANKVGGHSINELADMLSVSKQAVFKRVGLGAAIARQREQRQRRRRFIVPTGTQIPAATPLELPKGRESTGG